MGHLSCPTLACYLAAEVFTVLGVQLPPQILTKAEAYLLEEPSEALKKRLKNVSSPLNCEKIIICL